MEEYNKEIEDYIFNQMTERERLVFEKRLASDKRLLVEVNHRKLQIAVGNELLKEELMANLHDDAYIAPRIKPDRNVKRRYIITAIAASIALLITSFFIYHSSTSGISIAEQQVADYIDFTMDEKGDNDIDTKESKMLTILQERKRRDAPEAIDYFSDPFLKAHAYLLNKQPEEALSLFEAILNDSESSERLKQKTEFSIALARLYQSDRDQAKIALRRIIENENRANHRYYEPAKELLIQLEK